MTSSNEKTGSEAAVSGPWWTHGLVWLVIAGPAVVVVAGIATLVIALRHPEHLVAEDHDRQGIEIHKTLDAERSKALLPALQGRNHAATPDGDTPVTGPVR